MIWGRQASVKGMVRDAPDKNNYVVLRDALRGAFFILQQQIIFIVITITLYSYSLTPLMVSMYLLA